jgi:malate dehydrogenase (oxaloacetate-decarboxylating)
MALAAAEELAAAAEERGLSDDRILPTMDDWEVYARVATVTALQARRQGVARRLVAESELHDATRETIRRARATLEVVTREGLLD